MYQPFPTLLKPHVLSCKHGHWSPSHWPDAEMKEHSFLAKSLFLALKQIIFFSPQLEKLLANFQFLPSFKNYTSFFNDILRKLISQIEFMLLKHCFLS